MNNLPEYIELIKRYETITIEEIKEKNCDKELLTGFGNMDHCSLCKSAKELEIKLRAIDYWECNFCFWKLSISRANKFYCFTGKNQKSYDAIILSRTSKQLLLAYRNRAKHMRSVLEKLNIEMP